MQVYVLQHVNILPNDREDVKMIGVYSSLTAAKLAVKRLKIQPGFSTHPDIIDNDADEPLKNGFSLDMYEIDRDHWQEGFATLMPNGEEYAPSVGD